MADIVTKVQPAPTKLPVQELPDCREQPVCDPRPVCPVCGGLECLCRPRFFAGQLLTEDDLNRLERYVIDKNRLHNRYLFGSGVACGLEVVCTVCDDGSRGKVVVKPGYALSPCGNDIVVCQQQVVDICDLINRCRPPTDECMDPQSAGMECADAAEPWVLAVCYDEKPSRGVTALRGSGKVSSCSCGCSCGGCGCGGGFSTHGNGHGSYAKGGGGCSCQGGMSYAKKPPAAPQFIAAQCEPTLICEGFRFVAYKVPKKKKDAPAWGDLVKRFVCCILPFFEALSQFPSDDATQEQLHDWYLEFKQTVRDFIIGEGLYDCEIAQKFTALQDPQKKQTLIEYHGQWHASTNAVLMLAVLLVQKCLCSALLPPCPEPALADCVPLATITVRRNPCRVVHVCNLSARQFLLTMPNISYWLSWLPLFGGNVFGISREPTLRQLLELMCCTPVQQMFGETMDQGITLLRPKVEAPAPEAAPAEAVAAAADTAPPKTPPPSGKSRGAFAEMLWKATMESRPRMNAARFTLGAMGATDLQRQPVATDAELAQPAAALLLSQVVGPALRTLIPPTVMADRAPEMRMGMAADVAGREEELASLNRTITELRETLERQQRDIDRLLNR